MPKPEKVTAVADMKKLFEESSAFFVTDYQGLNVEDMTTLRKNLRDKQVRYLIGKNTLFRIAAKDAGVPDIEEHLSGPTAIAFAADDAPAAAKVLHDSYKDKELPRTKVFVVRGDRFEGADIKQFADLPSREELLAQVARAVEAPLVELARTIDGFFQQLILSVEALAEKRKSEPAPKAAAAPAEESKPAAASDAGESTDAAGDDEKKPDDAGGEG